VFNLTPRYEGVLVRRGTIPSILNLGTRCSWVLCFYTKHR